jgi:hypothetical protein
MRHDEPSSAARRAQGDSWRPLGRRGGCVWLAPHDQAVATIEAAWVPLLPGALPVPVLRLQDVGYQELFDVGVSTDSNCILVSSPVA